MNDTLFLMHFIGDIPEDGIQSMNGFDENESQLHLSFLSHMRTVRGSGMLKDFMKAVERISSDAEPFTVELGETQLFGKGKDIPVTCVGDDGESKSLHQLFAKAGLSFGASYEQPEFMFENFQPHITMHKPCDKQKVDSRLTVDTVTMVLHHGGLGGQVEVLRTFKLAKR